MKYRKTTDCILVYLGQWSTGSVYGKRSYLYFRDQEGNSGGTESTGDYIHAVSAPKREATTEGESKKRTAALPEKKNLRLQRV